MQSEPQPHEAAPRKKRQGGPGRIPFDLDEPVEFRPGTGEQAGQVVAISRLDRIREALRTGGYPADAAVRAGVTKQGLDEWIRTGTKAQADLLAGRRRLSQMTKHEKSCIRVAGVVVEAEAEARLLLLGLSDKLARGGIVVTRTQVKTENNVEVERRVTTETTLPDKDMIRWRLERRWPADFGVHRLEISGPDGGDIPVASPLAELTAYLDRIRGQHATLDPLIATNGHAETSPPTPTHGQ